MEKLRFVPGAGDCPWSPVPRLLLKFLILEILQSLKPEPLLFSLVNPCPSTFQRLQLIPNVCLPATSCNYFFMVCWSPPWKVPDIDYLPYPSFVTYSLDTLLCLSTQPNHFFVEKIMNRLCFKMASVQHFKGRLIQLWRIKTNKPIKQWKYL